MKKISLFLAILFFLNYSCSKKDNWSLGTGTPSTLPQVFIEHPIDVNFTINPSCYIFDDSTNEYLWFREKDFEFYASSSANLPNDSSGTGIYAVQIYDYYSQTYTDAQFYISTQEQQNDNAIYIRPKKKFNFFTLPYESGVATFSDTCYITSGGGKYANISQKTIPLIFSGFMDLNNGTGNIRIKGSVYLKQ